MNLTAKLFAMRQLGLVNDRLVDIGRPLETGRVGVQVRGVFLLDVLVHEIGVLEN